MNNRPNNVDFRGYGIGTGAITIIFIILKLTAVVDWPWFDMNITKISVLWFMSLNIWILLFVGIASLVIGIILALKDNK